MTFRLSSIAARSALLFAAVFFAVVLSYYSVRQALATHVANSDTLAGYQEATRLEPRDPWNWYLLGRFLQYSMEDPHLDEAIRAYRTGLALNPRSADIWLELGDIYDAQGDDVSAREAFVQAKRVYPASAEVSWRYGNFLLRQGEIPQAFAEIKEAVNADHLRGAEAFSRCWRVDPDINAILSDVILPDRDIYLDIIHELADDYQTAPALAVWDRLVAIHPAFHMQQVFELTNLLLSQHQIADVTRVWNDASQLSQITPPPDPPGSVLWDGGFETGVMGGFAWQPPPNPNGVQVTLDSREKHSGKHSLRLVFNGKSNVNFTGVCHFAEVQPSTMYRFSAWVRTQAITTDQGVTFSLSSMKSTGGSVIDTPTLVGTEPWTQIEMPWSPGSDVHEMYVCILRRPSAHFDNRIQGTAWIDDVALTPEPPKP